jgi:hypothetical protein
MRDPATGKAIYTRTGDVVDNGGNTAKTISANLIFKEPEMKTEIAMEVTSQVGGRKMQIQAGRDGDGHWRTRAVDIGHVTEVSPYAMIRVMDDEQINLSDVAEITEQMTDNYLQGVQQDLNKFDEIDIKEYAKERMEELQEIQREMRADFCAGMLHLFGEGWRDLAIDLVRAGEIPEEWIRYG